MSRCEAISLIIKDQCVDRFQCVKCSLSDCPYWIALQDLSRCDTIDRTNQIYLDPLEIMRLSHKTNILQWEDIFKMLEGGEN